MRTASEPTPDAGGPERGPTPRPGRAGQVWWFVWALARGLILGAVAWVLWMLWPLI